MRSAHTAGLQIWLTGGCLILCAAFAHAISSSAFESGQSATSLPIIGFTTTFLLAALATLGTFALVRRTDGKKQLEIVFLILCVGLLARLILLGSTPVLEVDFNRYLWDGGMTGNGHDPFATAPADLAHLPYDDPKLELSKAAGTVFDGISYPRLRTIYPPLAQAFFALAHHIAPWSLTAWRLVAIGCELMTAALIIALLHAVGRSPLWISLYWWNPLVLKEAINSAHMDVLLPPFVLGALLAAIHRRHAVAVGCVTLAIGLKLWPIVLVPLILRPLSSRPLGMLAACAAITGAAVAFTIPMLGEAMDETSGLVSFASHWTTNSALFPALENTTRWLLNRPDDVHLGRFLRALLFIVVLVAATRLAWPPLRSSDDILSRAYWTITALLLVIPAQFPWYLLWILPLAVTQPQRSAWFVAAAVMPIYYFAFHFNIRGHGAYYADVVVWIVWLPIWSATFVDIRRERQTARQRSQCLAVST